jgi:hypothetical protein
VKGGGGGGRTQVKRKLEKIHTATGTKRVEISSENLNTRGKKKERKKLTHGR